MLSISLLAKTEYDVDTSIHALRRHSVILGEFLYLVYYTYIVFNFGGGREHARDAPMGNWLLCCSVVCRLYFISSCMIQLIGLLTSELLHDRSCPPSEAIQYSKTGQNTHRNNSLDIFCIYIDLWYSFPVLEAYPVELESCQNPLPRENGRYHHTTVCK